MTLRLVLISSFTLSTALAFTACNPAIIADGIGASGGGPNRGSGGSSGTASETCVYNGITHTAGETFPDSDGCNTCTCETNGSVVCTALACVTEGGGGCVYDGEEYAAGQLFITHPGVNLCTCHPDGSVTCVNVGCAYPDGGSPYPDGGAYGDGGAACFYNCQMYAVGQTFPAGDGCNTCTCEPDGSVACSTACDAGPPPIPDGGPGNVCVYEGNTYAVGQTFPAGDGCNTCSCSADDTVLCTTIACGSDGGPGGCWYEGIPYSTGQSFPAGDGCNTCTCDSPGVVHCTEFPCAVDAGWPPPTPDGGPGCFYDGSWWAVDESFPAGDGCNTCTCEPNGTTVCTEFPCVADGGAPPPFDAGPVDCYWDGVYYAPGESFPAGDDCNECACTDDGAVLCTNYFCGDAGL
jgi:hypothetical protein